ncbi:hypothetical protein [Dyadobacter sp. CY312]|uniref:hypothetical protein n=1 Tax=Dyadobacter sp. CY312 TaxID=2907303 RepID=UPI001F15A0F0|nr:hypothetical protein [Dyadobacter sp. CY312]MCE7039252.1 hypothetical protein [Dyadobacter sp. CY312]
MNSIRIDVSVDDLSYLTEVAQNTYEVKVYLLDSEGQEIEDPNLPTSPYIALVETTSNTFTINLPIVDGNYPIDATVKVIGMEGCCQDEQQINLTNLATPRFAANYIAPTCTEEGELIPARFELFNIENITRVKLCYNELDFANCGDCQTSDHLVTGPTLTVPLDTPVFGNGSRFVILRGYNGPTCQRFFEVTQTITPIECETVEPPTGTPIPNICAATYQAAEIGGSAEYYWINNTGATEDIYWEWDTEQFPDRFQALVNNVVWHDTFCAGPLPNSCVVPGNCSYQPAKTYGLIRLADGDKISFRMNGDCGGSGGTVWAFKTSCNPFTEPATEYTGSEKLCTINILDATTGSGGRIYVNQWTGGLTGQYEFGIQLKSASDYNTVNWIQDYAPEPGAGIGIAFDGLVTGSEYRVWIRDKNSTSCNSFTDIVSL